jgi:hypothetical protein
MSSSSRRRTTNPRPDQPSTPLRGRFFFCTCVAASPLLQSHPSLSVVPHHGTALRHPIPQHAPPPFLGTTTVPPSTRTHHTRDATPPSRKRSAAPNSAAPTTTPPTHPTPNHPTTTQPLTHTRTHASQALTRQSTKGFLGVSRQAGNATRELALALARSASPPNCVGTSALISSVLTHSRTALSLFVYSQGITSTCSQ